MKGLIASIALIPSLVLTVQAHAGCGFMPDRFFESIMDSPDHTEETKQLANYTLQYTKQIRAQRTALEGWESTADDEQYPEEESPADSNILQQELASYDRAESVAADPNSTETRRRRRDRHRRQSSTLMRFIHNDNQGCSRTEVGPLVRSETSGPAIDEAINNVFNGFYWTDSLYRYVYGRNSIDNNGERYRARVHHCVNLNNAFWDGIGMFFGDGDGITTYKYAFPANQDVIGHEVTHGVIARSNPLHYFSETGALNEHIADVFGILSRQYRDTVLAADDSWLLGENIATDGSATRSMKAPGTASSYDNQPSNMADYYYGEGDDYGVHINSGIPNHAFYLFAVAQGGFAYYDPGEIWYNVLTRGQGSFDQYFETFGSFANKTLAAAAELSTADTVARLRSAWEQVGVL